MPIELKDSPDSKISVWKTQEGRICMLTPGIENAVEVPSLEAMSVALALIHLVQCHGRTRRVHDCDACNAVRAVAIAIGVGQLNVPGGGYL